ncbi:MAG: FtsX-like permease family protein, partial [Nocardioides sp.]
LALVAAAGGTPAQARRVVLASGVVLGLAAALLGLGVAVPLSLALMPLFQLASDTRFGPFDVEPLHLLGVAGFGVLSALLAAGVPAWLASRQDVVAVLAGRRGDARPSRRSPLLGLVLLAAGTGSSAYGASRAGGGGVPIAAGAVVCVLGMILLVPVVVAALARAARRLPLALRFAARDAARHRTRTVPAVAAVAATVAGVVALGIAITSDEAQNRETYRASLPLDAAVVTDYRVDADLEPYAEAVRDVAPDLEVERLRGIVERRAEVRLGSASGERLLSSYGGPFAATVLVAERVPDAVLGLDPEQRRAADRVLAEGGVLAFAEGAVEGDTSRVLLRGYARDADRRVVRAPAVFVPVDGDYATVQGVVAPAVAEELGARVIDAGLYLPGPVPTATAADLGEAVGAVRESASFFVERGYQPPDETVVVQLVLGALGAVLMLGGTLTATFLALSDARPDLATLSAVGAAPRTRRGVAAAYALVVGLVGAVLGALVGAVPGVAITYPLTGPVDLGAGTPAGPSHYLDVPWLLVLGVVVGLPVLTAVLVGLTARSRLSLTARLD